MTTLMFSTAVKSGAYSLMFSLNDAMCAADRRFIFVR